MPTYHAYAASAPKAPLEPFSFDPGELGPEEVEIKVTHCGICHSDLSMLDNDWGMSKYPFVPGHEVVGTVAALGDEAKGLKVGQRVGLGWWSQSCLSCHECLSGDHHLYSSVQGTIFGRHGGAGPGGHDEREQTLNQLLVEMDGFERNEGIIIIAATNRPDVPDPALLRPGRFDRHVVVPLPDIRGREQILKVHMRKAPVADDVKAAIIARGTPGFSGADLANLVNEAALFAAPADKRLVDMEDFVKAKDKIMMGAERKSIVMSEDQKRLTAYHGAVRLWGGWWLRTIRFTR